MALRLHAVREVIQEIFLVSVTRHLENASQSAVQKNCATHLIHQICIHVIYVLLVIE